MIKTTDCHRSNDLSNDDIVLWRLLQVDAKNAGRNKTKMVNRLFHGMLS